MRLDNKEMADYQKKAQNEKLRFAAKVKADNNRASDDIRRLTQELNHSIENL